MTYFLDLFSGIGGFALGAELAGIKFDGHYYSEVDDYAIRVYQRRFPEAHALGDIREIKSANLPSGEWIIAGGFPCQDISVAGKGLGLDGARSGLWFEYARLISELRPRYAIMENVGALVSRGLDRVLGSLAALGYDAEWQDIRASDVGAPHRRERIWIVAYPKADASCPDTDSLRPHRKGMHFDGGAELQNQQIRNPEQVGGDVSDALSDGVRDDGAEGALADANEIQRNGGRRTRDGRTESTDGCEALADPQDGWPVRRDGELGTAQGEMLGHRRGPENGRREWWSVEPDVGRVAYGVPSRVDRLKCLGNSIVPQIAEMIFRGIAE